MDPLELRRKFLALRTIKDVQKQLADADILPYSSLVDLTLLAIRLRGTDEEMLLRAQLKQRFRISDDQINTALFKRHSQSKVTKQERKGKGISMGEIDTLRYLLDGYIPMGDICLTYGAYGTGKTTLALFIAYNAAKGKNVLDRQAPCTPIKSLFIATDSGPAALKKSAEDIGIDMETDPLFQPGPEQMIWVWGYAPEQGHDAWICDIHGIIQLEQFIEEEGIGYTVIDSAKSVSSAAGWSYTSNESVKALLKHLREGICSPTGSCIDLLSHDGTLKGSHSGAKAWAEDPSMVRELVIATDAQGERVGVTIEFKKDRAAVVDSRRKVSYSLEDETLVLDAQTQVVGNCKEALLNILWEAHQNGVEVVRRADLAAEAWSKHQYSAKTVDNTLGNISGSAKGNSPTPVVKKGKGRYALAPKEVQRRQEELSPNRALYKKGGNNSKSLDMTDVCLVPNAIPNVEIGNSVGNSDSPIGKTLGSDQIPLVSMDLTELPPFKGGLPPKGSGVSLPGADDPHWGPPPQPSTVIDDF